VSIRFEEAIVPRIPAKKTALVLSGGGARGAYETGVIAYLDQELAPELGRQLPFDILAGTSIGALNACAMAAMADEPAERAGRLIGMWRSLNCDHVLSFGMFDAFRLLRESLGTHSGILEKHAEKRAGLVDTRGLQALLLSQIPWRRIAWNLKRDKFEALSIGATNVATGRATVFVQRKDGTVPQWTHDPGFDIAPTRISARHALASAAIPMVFPPVRIGHDFFVDGGLRLNVPLSPALRLGAERFIVISLRAEPEMHRPHVAEVAKAVDAHDAFPSAAFLLGKMFNAILGETVEQDIDRLLRLNLVVEAGTKAYGPGFGEQLNKSLVELGHLPLRQARTMLIRPSRSIGALAAEYMREDFRPHGGMASRTLRALAERESKSDADLVSYLLFEGGFADWLIDLGRRDARARRDEWIRFWAEDPASEWEQSSAA
jgi:NTE family protein